MSKLLSRSEKAQQLGITYRTLTNWIRLGKIEYFTIGKSKRKWFLNENKRQTIKENQR